MSARSLGLPPIVDSRKLERIDVRRYPTMVEEYILDYPDTDDVQFREIVGTPLAALREGVTVELLDPINIRVVHRIEGLR